GNLRQGWCRRDRLRPTKANVEVDYVGANIQVSVNNRLSQRSRPTVVGVVDEDRRRLRRRRLGQQTETPASSDGPAVADLIIDNVQAPNSVRARCKDSRSIGKWRLWRRRRKKIHRSVADIGRFVSPR